MAIHMCFTMTCMQQRMIKAAVVWLVPILPPPFLPANMLISNNHQHVQQGVQLCTVFLI